MVMPVTILLLYVDDMLIVGRDQAKIRMLKKALNRTFAMKDLGPARQILGMHIIRDRSKKQLWLSQERYVVELLRDCVGKLGGTTGVLYQRASEKGKRERTGYVRPKIHRDTTLRHQRHE